MESFYQNWCYYYYYYYHHHQYLCVPVDHPHSLEWTLPCRLFHPAASLCTITLHNKPCLQQCTSAQHQTFKTTQKCPNMLQSRMLIIYNKHLYNLKHIHTNSKSLATEAPAILHLASSEQWCWSGGRGILTELSLCITIIMSSSFRLVYWIGLWSHWA